MIVQGNQRVDSDTIRSYVTGAASGSPEEARRNLLATGLFSDVKVSRSGGSTVVSVRGRDGKERRRYDAATTGDRLGGAPMVVLINGASASASVTFPSP